MYDNLMNKFTFGGANVNGTYFDEPNRKLLQYVRNAYTRLGTALAIDNKKEEALKVLNKADKNLLENTFPYAMTTPGQMYNYSSMQTVYAYYLAGDKKKADEIAQKILKDCNQQLMYYRQLPASKLTSDLQHDGQMAEQFISLLGRMKADFNDSTHRNIQDQTQIIESTDDTTTH
jgi:tetratricopeptide (TPR) repeat protein